MCYIQFVSKFSTQNHIKSEELHTNLLNVKNAPNEERTIFVKTDISLIMYYVSFMKIGTKGIKVELIEIKPKSLN